MSAAHQLLAGALVTAAAAYLVGRRRARPRWAPDWTAPPRTTH